MAQQLQGNQDIDIPADNTHFIKAAVADIVLKPVDGLGGIETLVEVNVIRG